MSSSTAKGSSVEVPKVALYGLIASLFLLIAGAVITVFAGMPQRVADTEKAAEVNRADIASVKEMIRSMQTDVTEIRRDVKELRR